MTLLKEVKNHQRIKQMKRTRIKRNQLDPLNPLTISGFFSGGIDSVIARSVLCDEAIPSSQEIASSLSSPV